MTPTVLHLFSGIGGCTLGFQRAGFRSVGSIDSDAKACAQLERLTGTPAFCRDLAALQPAELAELVPTAPDVVVMSPPCKSFSGCMPLARSREGRYVDMAQLATRGLFLVLEAWPTLPKLILIENVPRIETRGAEMLAQLKGLLHAKGYAVDTGTHDCGELGGLAQHRRRFLLVARHMATMPDFVRRPPSQRVRSIGEVLLPLPSPAADHGDHMHRLPLLSRLNWLRLAAIRAGKDWRDLPAAIRIGGTDNNRHAGKMGVEAHDEPAHTVIGRGNRVGSGWASVADPRIGWDVEEYSGRPDSYGVADPNAPSGTIRALQLVQTSRASIADPRLGCAQRSGSYGVQDTAGASATIVGHHAVDNSPASVADPRLGSRTARQNGGFGVEDADRPAHVILGEGTVRNTRASVADPRLAHKPRRGTMGVLAKDEPATTIRGHHEVRQAPAAVVDSRGWPIPTHRLCVENGEFVLYGPPVDLDDKRPCAWVVEAPDKTWHRPMTDRELATLQGFPVGHQIEGPRSSSKTQAGVREWVGNAIPPPTAEAIAIEVRRTLESASVAGFLRGPDVWVTPHTVMESAP